jgi:hypothetical protein
MSKNGLQGRVACTGFCVVITVLDETNIVSSRSVRSETGDRCEGGWPRSCGPGFSIPPAREYGWPTRPCPRIAVGMPPVTRCQTILPQSIIETPPNRLRSASPEWMGHPAVGMPPDVVDHREPIHPLRRMDGPPVEGSAKPC